MSTPGTQPQSAGWYPDPAGTGGQRWHDGDGWTGQVTHGTTTIKGLGPGFAKLADWLGRGLVVSGAVYALGAIGLALLAMNPPALATTPDTAGFATTAGSSGSTEGGVFLMLYSVFSVLVLVTQIVWLVWQYQLAASAPAQLKRSPAAHVGWWFVPFANLVIPRANIGDLWHAYGMRRRGDPTEPTPVIFSVWWALWLSPFLIIPLMVLLLLNASTAESAVSAMFWAMSLMVAGQAGAGFAARSVVRDLSWRALLFHAAVQESG